jgi:anthranilate phosphoribosyltransferase
VHQGQELHEYSITPEDVGFTRVTDKQAFQGGDPTYNANLLRGLLSNQINGPTADMLYLNTAAALLANEKVPSLAEGVKLARATLHEGKAKRKLADVIECSRAQVR